MTCIRRVMIAAALSALVLAAGAASAAAQSPAADGYDERGMSTLPPLDTATSRPGESPPRLFSLEDRADDGGGSLAFTGLSLPALALLGGALLAGGALVRKTLV